MNVIIVTNLNERTIWQHILDGGSPEELCERIPDEFHDWVFKVNDELVDTCNEICDYVQDEFVEIMNTNPETRGDFAKLATKSEYRAYLFMLYDQRPIWDEVFKTLKPSGDKL